MNTNHFLGTCHRVRRFQAGMPELHEILVRQNRTRENFECLALMQRTPVPMHVVSDPMDALDKGGDILIENSLPRIDVGCEILPPANALNTYPDQATA